MKLPETGMISVSLDKLRNRQIFEQKYKWLDACVCHVSNYAWWLKIYAERGVKSCYYF